MSGYAHYQQDCPEAALLSTIGSRWVGLVIDALEHNDAPLRHSELMHRIPGITQRMLTQTLRTLERDGLLRRDVTDDIPARTFYALTEPGRHLAAALHPLRRWVTTHATGVAESRTGYDARRAAGLPTIAETNARRSRRPGSETARESV